LGSEVWAFEATKRRSWRTLNTGSSAGRRKKTPSTKREGGAGQGKVGEILSLEIGKLDRRPGMDRVKENTREGRKGTKRGGGFM